MQLEHTAEALRESVQQVLELMFFVSAEEALPSALVDPAILAQVEFRGQWTGRCAVEMPETFARAMACNFAGGSDPDDVDAGTMIETICEFANMICGNTITRLGCPGIVTLSPPHLIEEWPVRKSQGTDTERWLDTGEGMVHVRFETQVAA
jgi:CheY-specific phosphatase CheX